MRQFELYYVRVECSPAHGIYSLPIHNLLVATGITLIEYFDPSYTPVEISIVLLYESNI